MTKENGDIGVELSALKNCFIPFVQFKNLEKRILNLTRETHKTFEGDYEDSFGIIHRVTLITILDHYDIVDFTRSMLRIIQTKLF
jgi:hypothetical protein